ncbi:molybdopterin molybdenumtransferase MoeA, partial [bacterium]|nr:molybdopterin molybdenumtransferase MoeA [bacterium]
MPPSLTDPMNLLSVQQARERILHSIQPVGQTKIPLEQAVRRVLARDILAANDFPLFDNSAMDGFAIRSSDSSTSSVTLRV